VGQRTGAKLHDMGISTVQALKDTAPRDMRLHFGVVMERTCSELRGQSCLALEELAPARREIVSSRSFGQMVATFDELAEALSLYVARAAEKLRGQSSVCGALHVFVHEGQRVILDAKWKRLNAGARAKKYGIAQSDFYQLFAYAHKYIPPDQEHKELVLVYPKTASFHEPLPPFTFATGMTLWVLPFELGDQTGKERLIVPPEFRLARAFAAVSRRDDSTAPVPA
jgi:nucleotidyltransferase/DNA polymerase involved in DNA repair